MRTLLVAALTALIASPALAQSAWLPHPPQVEAADAAVRAPLEAYLRGHATGDPEQFRAAFHPDAALWGARNGTLIRMTAQQYIAGANGSAPADEASRQRRIESLDVTGDTASANISLDYPAVKFTDCMQLMRIDGEWRIVSKMFLAEPRTP